MSLGLSEQACRMLLNPGCKAVSSQSLPSLLATESSRVMFITAVCGNIQFTPQPVRPVSGWRCKTSLQIDSLRIKPGTCTRRLLLSCDQEGTRRGLPPIRGAVHVEAFRASAHKTLQALGDFFMHLISFNSCKHPAKHMFCPLTVKGKAC